MTALLDIEQLRRALARVNYKPGWRFHLYQHPHEGVWIAITAELPDSRNPDTMVVNCVRSAVPPIPHGRYFYEWLCWRLERIESHECREFLQVDGVAIFDPHAADANDD